MNGRDGGHTGTGQAAGTGTGTGTGAIDRGQVGGIDRGQIGRIRLMTAEDVPAVDALERRLFPMDAWPLQMFHDELAQRQTRHYLVAEDAYGVVLGYAGLMAIEPVGDIQTIAVVPEREGQGIGTALLTSLIEEARARAVAEVLLEVRSDNPRAQQLYRRFGFEQIATRRRYYRDGADALVMKLELHPAPGAGK